MEKSNQIIKYSMTIIGVFLATMVVGAIIILLIGSNPIEAYGAMFNYALGDASAVVNIMNRSMGLILSGLCAAVAFNAGISNLGAEGQIYLSAMAAALVGYKLTGLPTVIHLPLCFLAAISAGIIGAAIPGWLRVKLRVDEVISTIMLNSIFFFFTSYLATYPFRDPDRWSGTTPPIMDSAKLPFLIQNIDLRVGILISVVVAIILFIVMNYTNLGYRWKMVGLNDRFSQYGGVNVKKDQMRAMILSGTLSGLAGAVMVCGSNFRYWESIARFVGWDGVLIAMLANNNPLGVIASSILFAIFKNGALGMETVSQVPSDLTTVLLAMLILFVTGRQFVSMLLKKRKKIVQLSEEG
jgi:general nucleoside transport system permease protein